MMEREIVHRRSVNVDGFKTSILVEDEIWRAVKRYATDRRMPIKAIISLIAEQGRAFGRTNLSREIRLFAFRQAQLPKEHKFMKPPTKEQLDTAIAWLRSNEGDNGESQRCAAVADWMEAMELDRYIKGEARKAGVPVDALRRRLGTA